MFNCIGMLGALLLLANSTSDDLAERLWDAARRGDVAVVREVLEGGVDVNATTKYGATALSYACDRGHAEVVQLLLESGANPNAKDTFYGATPLDWAMSDKKREIIQALVENGAESLEQPLLTAVKAKNKELVTIFLDSKRVNDRGLVYALRAARSAKADEIADLLEAAGADSIKLRQIPEEQRKQLAGAYAGDGVQYRVEPKVDEVQLVLPNGQKLSFMPLDDDSFEYLTMKLRFEIADESASKMMLTTGSTTRTFDRVKPGEKPASSNEETKVADRDDRDSKIPNRVPSEDFKEQDVALLGDDWPGFRGVAARGVADGYSLPAVWDGERNVNQSWRQPIPGLGLSCPVIYGDRLFVTSAVSTVDRAGLKIGNYGDVASVDDNSEHEFVVICLDVTTGQQLWMRTAHVGPPRVKRHTKSSHANPTPVTDGRYVVVSFGSEGMFCYDFDGNLIWQRDLGVLDSGWFYDRSYQWGFGSSPIIDGDRIYIQCDIQDGSFLAALDLATGNEVWRTERDEIPTWSTPTICHIDGQSLIITNGTRGARGYDAATGKLRWWFDGHSEIVVPTPFVAHRLAYISSGYRPIQPIYAVDPLAEGDLKATLTEGETDAKSNADTTDSAVTENESTQDKGPAKTPKPPAPMAHSQEKSNDELPGVNPGIVWSKKRGGPYMPTPIVYERYLYTCSNQGIVACYDAISGEQVFRKRLNVDGAKSFVASPVAGDGKIYLTSEEGRVIVLRAGNTLDIIAVNDLGTHVLATPAISQGKLYFRGESEMISIELSRPPRP